MSTNHNRLARALYRSLSRWCRDAPSDVSLQRYRRKVAGVAIDSPASLQEALRKSFRGSDHSKRKMQEALEGLKFLNALDVNELPRRRIKTTLDKDQPEPKGTDEHSETISANGLESWLNEVEWAEPLSESKEQQVKPHHMALFPLTGPLLPVDNSINLPLFTHLSDIPVPAMEVSLRIFEPRYRELYHDAMASSKQRNQFVVPFSHPTLPGVYTKHALLYEIMRVEDVADETNGQIHLMAHHLVTNTVRMNAVVNPSVWKSQTTYLRIDGEILEDSHVDVTEEMKRTQLLLTGWKHPLSKRLLGALGEGVWAMAQVWISYLQMELLQMQAGIAAQIKLVLEETPESSAEEITRALQAPHRERLVTLQVHLATLVPRMLQLDDANEQCELLRGLICAEQERLKRLVYR